MGAHSFGNNCKSWRTRYLDKLLLRRCWQYGFIVGMSSREKEDKVATNPFKFWEESQSAILGVGDGGVLPSNCLALYQCCGLWQEDVLVLPFHFNVGIFSFA